MALSVVQGRGAFKNLQANWTSENTAGSGAITRYTTTYPLAVASVQVRGTFGGATVVLQGSNDGVTYSTLKDLQGNALSFTAAGYAEFSSAAEFLKPSISGGTGDSIDILISHWS